MENVIISFRAVMPLFLCMSLGFFLRSIRWVDQSSLNVINKLCFKIFLPVYLFYSIYNTNLSAAFNWPLLLTGILGTAALFAVLMLLIPRLVPQKERCGVVAQAIFRSNFVLLGLPIATYLCGEQNLGPTTLLISVMVPEFNVLAVFCLEYFRGGKADGKKILKGIVTNPLIIGSALGVLVYLSGIKLPYVLEKTTIDLSRVASPLALISLGGFFTFGGIRKYRKELTIGVVGKLIVAPAVMITVGVLLGFRGPDLVPLLIGFGAPTAVNSFTMAQQMDGDAELAAEQVVLSSACSILTIFCWILLLKTFALI